MTYSLVHISDLHFHQFPKTWRDWWSKRAFGTANLLLRRRTHYPWIRAYNLVHDLRKKNWDHLVISGDITTLALESEFQLARQTLEPLLQDPQKVTIIPGNHDRYVASACQPDLFRNYFGEFFTEDTSVKFAPLTNDWHLIAWDCSHPNNWVTAAGTVSKSILLQSEAYIRSQPDHVKFILINHYPIVFPEPHRVKPLHELYNLPQVKHWICEQPQIQLYLHGHIHHNWHQVVQRPTSSLHVINSASSTSSVLAKKRSAYHQIQLGKDRIEVNPQQF